MSRSIKALTVLHGEAVTTPRWSSLTAPVASGLSQAADAAESEPALKGGSMAVQGCEANSTESEQEPSPISGVRDRHLHKRGRGASTRRG